MTWHKERFTFNPNKFLFNCIICNKEMYFPKSKLGKYKTCGDKCKKENNKKIADQYKRNCLTCNKEFSPRYYQIKTGVGFHCSIKCSQYLRIKAAQTVESKNKRVSSFKKAIEEGRYVHPKGENHPKWKGGLEALKERQKPLLAERIKKYRHKNPEKTKEWQSNRRSKKLGRLPKGTIKNLMFTQKGKCIVCETNILEKYHVDHIQPLSKGGLHTQFNIQLLCPACNMRKSAKDPIDFMQENGKLL